MLEIMKKEKKVLNNINRSKQENSGYPYILKQGKIPDEKEKESSVIYTKCLQFRHPNNIAEIKSITRNVPSLCMRRRSMNAEKGIDFTARKIT